LYEGRLDLRKAQELADRFGKQDQGTGNQD